MVLRSLLTDVAHPLQAQKAEVHVFRSLLPLPPLCIGDTRLSNCRNFIFALSTFPSLLSLQPLGWVSWTQGYPSRGSEVHPRVFWRRMFQGFTDTCVCCMRVHPSAVCRDVAQGRQGEMWPNP